MPKPGRASSLGEKISPIRSGIPHVLSRSVILLDNHPTKVLCALAHRSGVAMNGRWATEHGLHRIRIPRGNRPSVEIHTETILEQLWSVEGAFHGELLVEEHPNQQSEPVGGQETVCLFGVCEVKEVRLFHIGQRY